MSIEARRIKDAVETCGFVGTGALASWLGVSRTQVIEAMNELKAKHPKKFMRIYGMDGGIGPL